MMRQARRPLRVFVAWRPQSSATRSAGPAKDLAKMVAWLAQSQDIVVRTATVISQTWPQVASATPSSDLYPVAPGGATGGEPGTDSDARPSVDSGAAAAFSAWLHDEGTAVAAQAQEQLRAAGVPTEMLDEEQPTVALSDHSETSKLIEAAEEFDADVIVIGSQTGAPKGHFRAGATANALLHCSPIPVLLVPNDHRASKTGPTRVTCAYVDTEQSQQALRHAADLANRWQVPLRLVAFSPRGATMYPSQIATQDHADAMTKTWKQQAQQLLKRGRKRALARHPKLKVETAIGKGAGWAAAIEDATWKKGDLLVLGSSVLGDFNRVFIGPSTSQILRHVPVPVFLSTV